MRRSIEGTAKMKVSSGNFVMAQPKGLQNGEDFGIQESYVASTRT